MEATAALDLLSPPTSSSLRPPAPYPSSRPPPATADGPIFFTSYGGSSLTSLFAPTTAAGCRCCDLLPSESGFSGASFSEGDHGRRKLPAAKGEFAAVGLDLSGDGTGEWYFCSRRNRRFPAGREARRSVAASERSRLDWWLTRCPTSTGFINFMRWFSLCVERPKCIYIGILDQSNLKVKKELKIAKWRKE
ncbi:NAC domain containing protein 58 [Striga asiatica]|uniref:NAC domain containing protein 58 n=1 Tax=Striga asiatica TaxID=4170 RepID=A0A5A7R5W3_STRAF|nr:NAC domain containing protein 58 [Striga asiatica]